LKKKYESVELVLTNVFHVTLIVNEQFNFLLTYKDFVLNIREFLYVPVVKTNQVRTENLIIRYTSPYLCNYEVTDSDDCRLRGLQYNRCKNNTLSPLWTEHWFQNKQYFNISDFNLADIWLQRKWGIETGDFTLLQYKWYFKLSDFNIKGVSCIFINPKQTWKIH
jgi:hypothetical protein